MAEFDTTEFLAHHGIKGQKWGVRRTPEELGHKTNTFKQKTKSAANKLGETGKTINQFVKKKAREHYKDYLRKNPEKLPKHARHLSKEEINEVISNIEFDKKLNSIRDDALRRRLDKTKRIAEKIGTFSNLLNNTKNLYNGYVEIYNTFSNKKDSNGNPKTKLKIGEKREPQKSPELDRILKSGTKAELISALPDMSKSDIEYVSKRLALLKALSS